LESYREEFRPSRWGDAPCVMLCVRAICAETEAAAEALARPIEVHRAALATQRVDQPLYDVRTAAAHVFTPEETKVVDETRGYQIQGTPEIVRARLTELAKRFRVDELIVVTPIAEAEDRARSIELIMAGGM
jgi:alkanesulfonate monooxygenase SsuD/methylene tetrahydromethanopterin reductase-like flavin-dependent oxidoreductase (luciferase family)